MSEMYSTDCSWTWVLQGMLSHARETAGTGFVTNTVAVLVVHTLTGIAPAVWLTLLKKLISDSKNLIISALIGPLLNH